MSFRFGMGLAAATPLRGHVSRHYFDADCLQLTDLICKLRFVLLADATTAAVQRLYLDISEL